MESSSNSNEVQPKGKLNLIGEADKSESEYKLDISYSYSKYNMNLLCSILHLNCVPRICCERRGRKTLLWKKD